MADVNEKRFTNVRIQHRTKTSAEWLAVTEAPLKGELCVELNVNESGSAVSTKIKIGDGHTLFKDLAYVGGNDAHVIETGVLAKGSDHMTAINALTGSLELHAGDIAIVKEIIDGSDPQDQSSDIKLAYTAYVYDGEAWKAMDGNYSADNVYFDADLTYTANIGTKTVPASGSGKISAKGKNVKQVLSDILALEKNPTTTQPTATLNSSNIGAKEVGEKVRIAYSFSTNAGSYTYGPATGVTFSGHQATFNGQTLEGASGTFNEVQVTDGMSLSIAGEVTCSDGAIPKTNLGNNYAAGQIKSKTFTPSKGTLTGFRGWFYGYKNGTNAISDPAAITSAQVRALGSGAKTSIPSQISTSQMKQMFFAIPKGVKTSVSVADATNGAPQTVTKITDVMVEGANGFEARAYDVWYVNNAAAATGDAKFNITVK